MSFQKYFINDYDYIKKAVWFIEKNDGIELSNEEWDAEWQKAYDAYDKNETIEGWIKMYYHYPSIMTLLRLLHPDQFDNIIVNKVVDAIKDNYVKGCLNITIVNHLVKEFKELINWNAQSKKIFVLSKNIHNENELKFKWVEVTTEFLMYLIELYEKIVEKMITVVEDDDLTKVKMELKSLPTMKYAELFLQKNAYRRHALLTNNYTEFNNNIMIFKNGFLDINTDQFYASISNTFDEFDQCMNLEWHCDDIVAENNLSKDNIVQWILYKMHEIFYNNIDKSVNIIYGLTSSVFMHLMFDIFGAYIYRTSYKDFISKGTDIHNKIVVIDSPEEVNYNVLMKNMYSNQHVFINCTNNQIPKFINLMDSSSINFFLINQITWSQYSTEECFYDIIFAEDEITEPFILNVYKEGLLCDANSVEYFIRSCINYSDDNSYTENDIYRKYLNFCKNNKMKILSSSSLFSLLMQKNVNVEGDIGQRIFSGFTINIL